MDLPRQLDEYATRICDTGLDGMAEIPVIADLIRASNPVIASVLEAPGEPEVARQRAFSVAARVLVGLPEPEQQVCSSALANAGVAFTPAPATMVRAA